MKPILVSNPKSSIKYGDYFELGQHRLINGDAKDPDIVKRLIRDEKVNLILTDVPYATAVVESKEGLIKGKTKHRPIANDHLQTDEEYATFTQEWIERVKPVLSSKNSIYIFNSDKMVFALREGMKQAGCHFAQLLIWVKTHSVMGRLDYLPQHELICYAWVGRHEFMKSKDKSVLIYPKPNKSRLHSTMKPIGLLRRLILNSSRIGDIIYDPFAGSGSICIASEQTKRRAFMIELDSIYCQTIIDRYTRMKK